VRKRPSLDLTGAEISRRLEAAVNAPRPRKSSKTSRFTITKGASTHEVEVLPDGTVRSDPPLPKDRTAEDFFRMLREKVAAPKSGKATSRPRRTRRPSAKAGGTGGRGTGVVRKEVLKGGHDEPRPLPSTPCPASSAA
jgi:hypothetical protein